MRKYLKFLNNFDVEFYNSSRRLRRAFKRSFGRGYGSITVRHIGGGVKKFYSVLDLRRSLFNCTGVVVSLQYDPFRKCKLMLIFYPDFGIFAYAIAVDGIEKGFLIKSKNILKKRELVFYNAEVSNMLGWSFRLIDLPIGTIVSNIEGRGHLGIFIRACGCFGVIFRKFHRNTKFVGVRLPSKKLVYFVSNSLATIGGVMRSFLVNLGKAGLNRHRNIRPSVRGVAMNPVDHPHGGGEGKTSGGRISVTPWGFLTKGVKTCNIKKFKLYLKKVKRINKMK